MRDLNECKAEVFRRSERRIQARRKARNRILACCVPLCLAVAVWSVTILSTMLQANKSSNLAADGAVEENSAGSHTCSYTEVVIRNADSTNGDTQRITDKVEITRIFEAVFVLDGSVGVGSATGVLPPEAILGDTGGQQTDHTSRLTGYIITFITEDGTERVYTLNKNELRNISENTKTVLSDAQVKNLKTALGISD